MICPKCKIGVTHKEQCEDEQGEPAYVADVCPNEYGCGWSSDYPEPLVAGNRYAGEHCEGCSLPIKPTDLILVWGDEEGIYTHHECPTEARA